MPGQATDERSRPPEPLFHFLRNRCSTSSGFRVPLPGFAVPLPPESLFHFLRIPCSTSSGIPTEPASRPSAPRSGGGAKRRALTSVSTRARCWLDDAAGDHNILRSTRVQFLSVPRARQQLPVGTVASAAPRACNGRPPPLLHVHDDVHAVVRPNRASGARGSGSRFSIVAVVSPSGSRPYEALDSVSVSSPSSCASSSSET